MKARIAEIFESIQGEGLYVGERQIFVRFFGCNLYCKFCDTRPKGFAEYEPQGLLDKIKSFGSEFHSVSFTGGEPLLQKDFLKESLSAARSLGHRNYLETNGTLPGELECVIGHVDIVAMDFKLPSSSDMGNLWGLHRRFLKVASQKEVFIKAVVCQSTAEGDIEEAVDLIKEINKDAVLVLQPNSDELALLTQKLEQFRALARSRGVGCRIIPQVHKIMGVK